VLIVSSNIGVPQPHFIVIVGSTPTGGLLHPAEQRTEYSVDANVGDEGITLQ
jgi:hypothetical protein